MTYLLFISYFLTFLSAIQCLFNFNELKNLNYDVAILQKPVVMAEPLDPAEESVVMTSIHGQLYQCTYLNDEDKNERTKEEEQKAVDTGVTELLKPLSGGLCLFHTKDWWTYELCPGESVKQYHLEGSDIMGNTIHLGQYESDFLWDKETEHTKKNLHNKQRFHSQEYVNGTVCDLTNRPRRTQVRYFCEDGSSDYIRGLDEPESCVYVLSVYTNRLCKHPLFKPEETRAPVPITCQPLLSAEDYHEYTVMLQRKEEEAAKLQRMKEEGRRLRRASYTDIEYRLDGGRLVRVDTEHLTYPDNFNAQLYEDTALAVDEATALKMASAAVQADLDEWDTPEVSDNEEHLVWGDRQVKRIMQEALRKTLAKTLGEEWAEELIQDGDLDVNVELIRDTQDLKQVIDRWGRELNNREIEDKKEGEEKEKSETKAEVEIEEEEATVFISEGTDQKQDGAIAEDEDEFLRNFERELDKIPKRDVAAKHRDNIESVISSQFTDILDEAEAELGEGGLGEDYNRVEAMKLAEAELGEGGLGEDRVEAMKLMNVALKQLLDKLSSTEHELVDMDKVIHDRERKLKKLKEELGLGPDEEPTEEQLNQLRTFYDENEADQSDFGDENEVDQSDFEYEDEVDQSDFEDENEADHYGEGVLVEDDDQIKIGVKNAPSAGKFNTPKEHHKHELKSKHVVNSHRSKTQQTLKAVTENNRNNNNNNEKLETSKHSPKTEDAESADRRKSAIDKVLDSLLKGNEDKEITNINIQTVRAAMNGHNVEIKVVTTGFIDKDGEFHLIEDSDSDVSSVIINMLYGGGAEQQEISRQQQLEQGYSFRFDGQLKSRQKQNGGRT